MCAATLGTCRTSHNPISGFPRDPGHTPVECRDVRSFDARSKGDEQLLAALLDGMEAGLCAFDREGVVTHWNAGATRVLGWSAQDAVGRRGFDGWAARSADARQAEERLTAAMAADGGRSHEFALLTKDGRRVLVRARSAALRDTDGQPSGLYCAFSEAQAQIDLERNVALSRSLLADASWGVVLVDADLRPAQANEQAARLLRTGRAGLLGRPLADLLTQGAQEVENALQYVLAEGAPMATAEIWVSPRADPAAQRSCWRSGFIRLGPPLGAGPVPLGVGWLFTDITAQKEAEQENTRIRFRYQQLHRADRSAAECENPLEAAALHLDFALAGFADHALVDLLDPNGHLVRILASPDGESGPCRADPGNVVPVAYLPTHPAFQALERLGSVRTSSGSRAPGGAGDWAAARQWPAGAVHGLTTVLRSRARTVGALTFLRGGGRRLFDRADVSYAEDVAARVATALDLARLGPGGAG